MADKLECLKTLSDKRAHGVDGLGGDAANDAEEGRREMRIESVSKTLSSLLRPKVNVLVSTLCGALAQRAIGTAMCWQGRASRLALIDAAEIMARIPGLGRSSLQKGGDAGFAPMDVWEAVLQVALKSNLLGEFVLVNLFQSRLHTFPAVRDQLALLESMARIETFVVLGTTMDASVRLSGASRGDAEEAASVHGAVRQLLRITYMAFEERPLCPVLLLPPPVDVEPSEPPTYGAKATQSLRTLALVAAADFEGTRPKGKA